jgi:hypothetical protein
MLTSDSPDDPIKFDDGCGRGRASGARPDIAGTVGPHSAFLAFLLLALSQPYPRAATILVDELYAGSFQGQAYFGARLVTAAQRTVLSLQALDSWDRNVGSSCQLLL